LRIHLTQKNGFELVHARVGKQQRGIVQGRTRRGRLHRVTVLRVEEIHKRRPHLIGGPVSCCRS
jgi:hypothetical protein